MPRTTLSVSATMSAATEAGTPLAASNVPPKVAADIVALTLGVVRGMALRTLWDNDPKWFDHLFELWRRMIKVFLESQQNRSRLR